MSKWFIRWTIFWIVVGAVAIYFIARNGAS